MQIADDTSVISDGTESPLRMFAGMVESITIN